ncbi:hypothetical protein UFOVP837_30 [uncultured Caudovirales phage]|uniref:Uncharacterized protein n=1 Tax=uncultured Caudovirales phage TaxID=2100421 RepID=A0A6J5P629_9CAUD|nr:hypothetical protein UFOVP837_30 [uncultured Caudovirales phage]
MIYKMLPLVNGEQQIFARIDDDGLCRLTCSAEYPQLKADLVAGAELQDADGNVMSPEAAQEFIRTLP